MISTSNQPEIKNVATAGQDADAWFTPGRFAALLAALIVVCFPKVVFGLETFFYKDYGLFAYPMAFYHHEAFWRGEMPLWNPYNYCGLPFLAQWNTLTLYPPSLFYLVFPLTWSLGIFNLAHLFWAGLGMYFLAYRWTGNRLAASVAGVAYAFNGLSWSALMWTNNIAALGWMPWVVLCVERAWREGGGRNLILASLAGAMQTLAGAPEVIILTWFALGLLWLTEWIGLLFKEFRSRQRKEADGTAEHGKNPPPDVGGYMPEGEASLATRLESRRRGDESLTFPSKTEDVRASSPRLLRIIGFFNGLLGQMAGRLLIVVFLVAGLAAAQLLPFADLLLHSQRDTSFGDSEWSMPRGGWANYLVPMFHSIRGPLGGVLINPSKAGLPPIISEWGRRHWRWWHCGACGKGGCGCWRVWRRSA